MLVEGVGWRSEGGATGVTGETAAVEEQPLRRQTLDDVQPLLAEAAGEAAAAA